MNEQTLSADVAEADDAGRDASGIPQTVQEFLEWDLDAVDLRNLDLWVPKALAAALLGISERQLERDSSPPNAKIEKRNRPIPGGSRRPIPVYNPRDIQTRMRASLRPTTHGLLMAPPPPQETSLMRLETIEQFATAVTRLLPPPQPAPQPEPPLFMDLETACIIAGVRPELREAFGRLLRAAIRKKELKAHRVGKTFFIHRDALFNFHPTATTASADDDTSA